ncbi:MAG: tRNA preQ1(34) S-adenosylmethionine ribosyltransferase-isomerase QueA [Anaerolineae bacterium]|uniref:tRNA preQ1(34) S-adenosylmethionine ribosyltransferase-isomerase QueA n=1 Tax=Promineifilum sp. TaxID=2664178 RepID=UPI001D732616|nr:tRNA preQ1(34) S-adenosylmethionine ribosyltransferase-isomerase QueA [Anaerolineales bacterium]MCO5179617.1 tRNA preQ1(34) S-adenosylmethionine ribosyltransferase-isomerase QueA [Promineifilum sp.]MCW5846745.1 tRNA preQ1(34) S-adenosylmethionine ribosyltransferase-isomerase QueA [Anaerolineae bacterium]
MKVSDFDYDLPETLIAQHPLEPRDASRLLVLDAAGRIEHRHFRDLPDYLRPGDILVANDTRVIPARLFARKPTGGRVEILLLERTAGDTWKALVGGRNVAVDLPLTLLNRDGDEATVSATVTAVGAESLRELRFSAPVEGWIESLGYAPLPPYIHEPLDDPERYQTIYARPAGSAAAPTAGLHFTAELLLKLREQGVMFETVTLHVGLDTFKPVAVEEVTDHVIHTEWARLSADAARRINDAHLAGGRIVAVGTTTARVLETAALRSAGITGSLNTISARDASGETTNLCPWKPVAAFEGPTDLFIHPGYRFRAMDALITNFHLPRSSLLMLVAAFVGRETILDAYRAAVAEQYRFYSFGDAMLLWPKV